MVKKKETCSLASTCSYKPISEKSKYANYLNDIDHSIDCIENWPEPISRHRTCLANISIKQ